MKAKIVLLVAFASLSISSAWAEGWNTGTDLIKAGTRLVLTGPVVLPVRAIQKVAQGKFSEAASDLLFTPVAPIAGIGIAGFGVLCNITVDQSQVPKQTIPGSGSAKVGFN